MLRVALLVFIDCVGLAGAAGALAVLVVQPRAVIRPEPVEIVDARRPSYRPAV